MVVFIDRGNDMYLFSFIIYLFSYFFLGGGGKWVVWLVEKIGNDTFKHLDYSIDRFHSTIQATHFDSIIKWC
jgi:hypothetical protein